MSERPTVGAAIDAQGEPPAAVDADPLPLARRFDLTVREAIDVQTALAGRIERQDRLGDLRTVAGVDVAYGRRGRAINARAAAVLLDLATLQVLDRVAVEQPSRFPYVPGLLTFREAPAAVAAVEALRIRPDLLLCDGQGIAHPRRCGMASHLGLALDLPSIGAAKSRLIGTHAEPGIERGCWTPLYDGEEVIGACLRTRRNVAPIFVSIGHRVSLHTAVHLVLRCARGLRLPEPTRLADRLSKASH